MTNETEPKTCTSTLLTPAEIARHLVVRGKYASIAEQIIALEPGAGLRISTEGVAAKTMATIRARIRKNGLGDRFLWRRLSDSDFLVGRNPLSKPLAETYGSC